MDLVAPGNENNEQERFVFGKNKIDQVVYANLRGAYTKYKGKSKDILCEDESEQIGICALSDIKHNIFMISGRKEKGVILSMRLDELLQLAMETLSLYEEIYPKKNPFTEMGENECEEGQKTE